MAETNSTVIAKVDELKDGELKEVEIGETKILLVKEDGQFSAVGGKCPHSGAPLKTGSYFKGRIRCPWHGACFSTTTGDIEDYPTAGCLPKYNVTVSGNDVVLTATAEQIKTTIAHKPFAPKVESDERIYVVIGAGAAGTAAVETLRSEGYTGRIVLIERTKNLPYDRTKLSKAMDLPLEKILLKKENFFKEANVELLLGVEVISLDVDSKTIILSNQQTIKYSKVLIASGGDPQKLTFIPGHDGSNVHTLRTVEDAHRIISQVEGKNVVIVGSSFIGMEVAASIVKKSKSVTVLGMESVPFERVLGLEVGKILKEFHESQGIKFILNAIAKEFQKTDNLVHTIILKDDTKIAADIVLIGAGVVPATSFIKGEKIKIEKDKSIIVQKTLEVSGAPGVFAAGDIARYPFAFLHDAYVRIEHWGVAMTQGALAAKNMILDVAKYEFTNIPFFWTAQYGKSVRYSGYALQYDKVLLDTQNEKVDPKNPKFVAFYSYNNNIVAVCTIQRDPVAAQVAEIFTAKIPLTFSELEVELNSKGSVNELLCSKLKK